MCYLLTLDGLFFCSSWSKQFADWPNRRLPERREIQTKLMRDAGSLTLYVCTLAGIGRSVAKALSDLGAEVHGMTKTASKLDSLRAECPRYMALHAHFRFG